LNFILIGMIIGNMIIISLDEFKNGLPTLTSAWGAWLSEAALFCLTHWNHTTGVLLRIINQIKEDR